MRRVGRRLVGQLYRDKSNAGKKPPTIGMVQGWGGTAQNLQREAVALAQARYLALAFDYRG